MNSFLRIALLPLASFFGGALNGLFGSGGGIPLIFSLEKIGIGRSKYRITLSLCVAFSLFCILFRYQKGFFHLSFLPILLSAMAGGWLGSRLLFSLKSAFLHRLFCILLLVSGGVMIWRSVR